MIKVGIIGATGYTGAELLRLLVTHPKVNIHAIASTSSVGKNVSDIFPNLRSLDEVFCGVDDQKIDQCELVFFATPHGQTMNLVQKVISKNIAVIDLSADFRLKDVDLWNSWYNTKHTQPQLIERAVYGLPQINKDKIKNAQLVANPGCYPTSVILGLLPILKNYASDIKSIICDCKSGVSGAGRSPSIAKLLCEVSESLKPYNVTKHRHLPEIMQILEQITGMSNLNLTFTPHLIPMIRGMLASIYIDFENNTSIEHLRNLYVAQYADDPFVSVLKANQLPETRNVAVSNHCQISLEKNEFSDKILVFSAIDNLVKGASGQAVENMNIMFGFKQDLGLRHIASNI